MKKFDATIGEPNTDAPEEGGGSRDRFLPVNLLRLFDALYQHGTVTRAASALGVSQPTASAWLGELRREFSDSLFVRADGRMRPTHRAEELITTVRQAIEALRSLGSANRSFDPRTSERRFSVESPDGTHVTILPRLLHMLEREAPNVHVQISVLSEAPEEGLRSGLTDVALMLGSQKFQREFGYRELSHEGWDCLVGANHPLLTSPDPMHTYTAARHINVVRTGWSGILERGMATMSVDRRIALELPGVLGLPALLAQTDMVVTVPEGVGGVLARDPLLAAVRCPVPVPGFSVCMYWSHRHDPDPGHQWLRQTLMRAFET